MSENQAEIRDRTSGGAGLGCTILSTISLMFYVLSPPVSFIIYSRINSSKPAPEISEQLELFYPIHVWLYENNEYFANLWGRYIAFYSL